ncbi:hypothetical protein ACFQ4K_20540 [Tistrella bauzanensis]
MTTTTHQTVQTPATEPPARVTIARADGAGFAGDGLRAFSAIATSISARRPRGGSMPM